MFPSSNFVLAAGVAIFHLASQRVVICSARDRYGRKYWFLPKGRRDAGEESGRGAEREGFEESGYRNRLLPLPTPHLQPQPYPRLSTPPLTAEPIWTQLLPLHQNSIQYILFWYISETLPPSLETKLSSPPSPSVSNQFPLSTSATQPYKPPPPFPTDLTLRERIAMEPEGYEPVKHEGTSVDEEERTYESYLVSVEEAVEKLRGGVMGDVMADVVGRGWRGIRERLRVESEEVVAGEAGS
ncbi:hypothetical protein GQ43DRAFT_452278 [Delitschia confertaspora ATCC 74209]|uniref:Nudix hydrolase domain-containing protein n=1 Tax=Delitschia confertaspora ATCC 74209 TaxID=1513339 RepID=A0A9P4JDZ2_9PLEO|nr:hypothetical protein GQ43DRAFT_452278 [Delitschia confertaspora ATCC 74209]